jgi:rod shape-determining protein MreD
MRAIVSLVLILLVALLLQTALVSRITLLSGHADLVLVLVVAWALQERVRYAWICGAVAGLVVGAISGAPWFIYLLVYLGVVVMARLLTRRIWQAPLLAMFAVTFSGTIALTLFTFLYRFLFEITQSLDVVFIQIIMPSILLNLLLATAIHPLMRDLAGRIYQKDALE